MWWDLNNDSEVGALWCQALPQLSALRGTLLPVLWSSAAQESISSPSSIPTGKSKNMTIMKCSYSTWNIFNMDICKICKICQLCQLETWSIWTICKICKYASYIWQWDHTVTVVQLRKAMHLLPCATSVNFVVLIMPDFGTPNIGLIMSNFDLICFTDYLFFNLSLINLGQTYSFCQCWCCQFYFIIC